MSAFHAEYRRALGEYTRRSGESRLHAAYELGRDAVGNGLGIVDLVVAHQQALLAVLGSAREPHDASLASVRAAGDFLLESVSAFEMVQRGYGEVRDAALHERRRAELVRSLSGFLADASLSEDSDEAREEVFHLVTEQARELIPVACCLATAGCDPQAHARTASGQESDPRWQILTRWTDLSAIEQAVRGEDGATRLGAEDLARWLEFAGTSAESLDLRNWLGAPLIALDGRRLGAIHLVNRIPGEFSSLDEAVVVHLAQMAAAALERARVYGTRRP